jgi:carbon storage regulator CsrA
MAIGLPPPWIVELGPLELERLCVDADVKQKMLILARHTGEQIQIGDDVRITVKQITANKGYLAIDAPTDVLVLRGELSDDQDPGISERS